MVLVDSLILSAVGMVGLPMLVLSLECVAAVCVARRRKRPLVSAAAAYAAPRIDVLIPAHNEQQVLAETLANLADELSPHDRVWVIADNCTDATAEIARAAGVHVLERHDASRRGKGYALDFALRRIAHDHGNVVVVIDADCALSPGSLEAMASLAMSTRRPVQASYAMLAADSHSPRDFVSQFAVLVKNVVRPLGMSSVQLPCMLTGSGMAFPWAVLQKARLATGNIVEDMKLGIDLVLAGHAPLFCPEASVTAPLPTKHSAAVSQRTRWEHGHLQTMVSQIPRLLWAAIVQRRPRLVATALDLAVPPLSLLVLAWVTATCAAMIEGVRTGFWLPSVVSAATGGVMFAAMLLVNRTFNPSGGWRTMASVPIYVVTKMPIYAGFVRRRQTDWVRTAR
ncbi:MAG TPA: glycosyltransferase family 2 protein [Pirellulales bacterium]|nr:glycosyltransferase family 2 protein [Pirellulales bacterium]